MRNIQVFSMKCAFGTKRETTIIQHHTSLSGDRRNWNSSDEKMNSLFDTSYIDLFDFDNSPTQLVNFATGVVARKDMQDAITSYVAT